MRELLGGKGANVAEMTRVLGTERVPAGFTITTEACVAYMQRALTSPTASTSRWQRRCSASRTPPARRSATTRTRCSCRSAAARASRCRGCSTRSSTSGLNDTSVAGAGARRPTTSASPGTPTGGSSRCSATSSTGSPGERFEDAIAEAKRDAGVRPTPSWRSTRCKELVDELQGLLRRSPRTRRSSCARRSARCSTPGPATARSPTGGSTGSPTTGARRSTSSRWCSATRATTRPPGVAFSRDEVTGAPEPSRRLPGQRPGRGRRLGRPHARATSPSCADVMPEAHAQLMEILRTLEAALQGHAGRRVHGRGGAAVHAPDAQRQAAGAGRGALRGRRGDRGPADARGGAAHDRRRRRSTRCCTRPSTASDGYEVLAQGVAASPGAAAGRDRVHRGRRGRGGRRRAAT